ncbi:MAG TPA: hypothetical protein V6D03_00970, partial [Candidatus Caenarcaniphilales bacterium]
MNHRNGFLGRRDLLELAPKLGLLRAFGLAATASNLLWKVEQAQAAELTSLTPPSISPADALQKLIEGNQRFVQHQPQYPDQSEARLREVAQAQHPFATVLSCADSRVPAEIVFD